MEEKQLLNKSYLIDPCEHRNSSVSRKNETAQGLFKDKKENKIKRGKKKNEVLTVR